MGKDQALKKLMADVDFRKSDTVFMLRSASKEEVSVAGEDSLLMIYDSSKWGKSQRTPKGSF